MFRTKHISVSVKQPTQKVYEFVSNPENLPLWASGLSDTIRKEGTDWVADSPMGAVKIKFSESNSFGILDHVVTLPSGETFYNPLRVFTNNGGSELVFTLFQYTGMTDVQFDNDAALVENDLKKLKAILEKES